MSLFGGLPMRVEAEPMLEAVARAIRYGTGSRPARLQGDDQHSG